MMIPKPSARAAIYEEKDVWNIFTPLAIKHNAVNLGQGFPNLPVANFVKDAVKLAVDAEQHQYAPTRGLLQLRQVLAKEYGKEFCKSIDPNTEIMVSIGANQGIGIALQAFVNPGEQVILIEPFFDIFKPEVEIVGGEPIYVPLRLSRPLTENVSANEWKLDFGKLESIITSKTKAIILNSPHNPTGKIFSLPELERIAQIATKHNLLVISDEVYDKIYFGATRPPSISQLPGMWERTITVGSAGKTFGVTGWRIGWLMGSPSLIKAAVAIHSRTVFTAPTPLQAAVAKSFELAQSSNYFSTVRNDFMEKRDKLIDAFNHLGFPVIVPEGSYFFIANMDRLEANFDAIKEQDFDRNLEPRDYLICRWLTTHVGVTAIPLSPFFQTLADKTRENWIRICFCKTDQTITEAISRLQKLKDYVKT